MEKASDSKKGLGGHSLVNKYDLMSLEQGQGLTLERMVCAFQALDELIPQLGVFTRIFRKLRDDLFEAVYSDELTGGGSAREGSGEGEVYIQRLPYFHLVQRGDSKRSEKMEEMQEQLDIVKKRLFEKHKQLEEWQQKGADLQDQIASLNEKVADLEHTIADKNSEISRLQKEMEASNEQFKHTEHQLQCDITDLRENLTDAQNEIEYLSNFKKGYDSMYYAFLDKAEEDHEEEPSRRKKKAVVATKRANLISNIDACNTFEKQYQTVLNTAIEEFDKFLEDHKDELAEKVVNDEMTDAEFDLQEIEIDQADQQLESVQERFRHTVGEVMLELELLQQHNTMLMEQLQTLEENKPAVQQKRKEKSRNGDNKSDSVLSAGLGEEEEEAMMDPFITQERVFSKYAAMLYTSNNQAKTFEEFKDAKYCPSCGEKTVICPHKLGGSEKVYILPHNCTHIKIVRPKVRINKELVEELVKPLSPDTTIDLPSAGEPKLRGTWSRELTDNLEFTVAQTPTTCRDSPSLVGGEAYMSHTMQRLWDDFHERTKMERVIPRHLGMERTFSLMEQFSAFLCWQDDNGEEEEGFFSILDNLYRFFSERYLVEDVLYLAVHDFLQAVVENSGVSKMIQLLSHILVGNLDGACLRYVLLMTNFIDSVDWRDVEDFRAFASVVYPFLGEDDLETLQMSYTSFSENHISKSLVANFIFHIILKYREPRFLELENRLVPFQTSEGGMLTDKEFKEALDSILPLSNERMRRRLFEESERAVEAETGIVGTVPIMRLAQIAGYLGLLQITNVVKENVAQRIHRARERLGSQTQVAKTEPPTQSQEKLLTLKNVRTLATNISRRRKYRERRLHEEQEESDW